MIKRFKLFLESFADDKVHRNPSVAAMKGLIKNSPFGTIRYVLHKDGTVYAGNAGKFTHEDLHSNPKEWHSYGVITHHPEAGDSLQYTAKDPNKGHGYEHEAAPHGVFDRWERQGLFRK